MQSIFTLPDGKRGQALAIAVTLIALSCLWLGAAQPLISSYQSRAYELAQSQDMAARMAALGQEIPALRAAVALAGAPDSGGQYLLAGGSDEIAGANLQSALQDLASQAGTSLDSAALMPAQQTGALRRITVQVTLTATWGQLTGLLEAIAKAQPRMVVDTISITNAGQPGTGGDTPVQVSFDVSGFCAGGS